jgi:hypothetical protein
MVYKLKINLLLALTVLCIPASVQSTDPTLLRFRDN